MDKLKTFFAKSSTDKRFKKAGPGVKLGAEEQHKAREQPKQQKQQQQALRQDKPLSAAAAAAQQRALERQNRGKPSRTSSANTSASASASSGIASAIPGDEVSRMRAEMMASSSAAVTSSAVTSSAKESQADQLQVRVECPLTCDTILLKDKDAHAEATLREMMKLSPLDMSVKMLHTLNDSDTRTRSSATLTKYIENLLEHPDEPKFRNIREANKAFQARVATVVGAVECLQAIGFERDTSGEEVYYRMASPPDPQRLQTAKLLLGTDQRLVFPLSRDTKIYKIGTEPSSVAVRSELPPEFYHITLDDIRAQHRDLAQQADQAMTLRTQAMREAQKNKSKRRYVYCLIRVRINKDYVVQGTFKAADTVSHLYMWMQDMLADTGTDTGDVPFILQLHPERKQLDDPDATLSALGMVPTAVLHVVADTALELKESLKHMAGTF